ncbi:acyltransferase [Pseudarthrobacter sulfonivorans]|uniref:acyltransferase family protein n=1 Tax=Pseudarthrobacter sulfonivorans TaxID=121292 RepID=UPI0028603B2F|nr:acyltransferase [Pseudarthrobacter sulfonivorans]MDR6415943.1 peptidoglycan/LPS O-acetylase OafA/YrhL [Pseudarthrobacter sulfonivorans]
MENTAVSTNPAPAAAALGRVGTPNHVTPVPPVPGHSGRDRYLDLLRAIALVRVVAYHTFSNAAWLSLVFPSMGVMFALAGALMARSLERPALGVLKSRTRRLLLPLWVYSATVLFLILWQGWSPDQDEGRSWSEIVLWFIPLGDPPYPESIGSDEGLVDSAWAADAGVILWYIRAYFWFMLLSPLLLAAFRRLPWITLAAPLGIMVPLAAGWVTLPDWADSGVGDFATYGSCWILGFAHYFGLLRSVPRWIVFSAGPVIMALGFLWAAPELVDEGWDLNNIGGADGLWAFGFCAMLLRISPSWKSLPRPIRLLDKPVTLINNRAVTVYLWHTLLLAVSVAIISRLSDNEVIRAAIPWLLDSEWTRFGGVWLLLAIVFLTIGWTEDVAAKRTPRLWPDR